MRIVPVWVGTSNTNILQYDIPRWMVQRPKLNFLRQLDFTAANLLRLRDNIGTVFNLRLSNLINVRVCVKYVQKYKSTYIIWVRKPSTGKSKTQHVYSYMFSLCVRYDVLWIWYNIISIKGGGRQARGTKVISISRDDELPYDYLHTIFNFGSSGPPVTHFLYLHTKSNGITFTHWG